MEAHSERSEVRTCSSPSRPKVMAPKMMGRGVLAEDIFDVWKVEVVRNGNVLCTEFKIIERLALCIPVLTRCRRRDGRRYRSLADLVLTYYFL
jgi:hypothetical protein